ncbi:MAG: hypothetical protein BGN89_17520 [Alphaproteobacteria bacterium 64-6]|nr:MAG: hypothetical protein BGN89_17520 [Alphaproteobacteria bacterium 64-6]
MLSQALVLCGGLGTRLGELTASTPKPMLPVAGRPFLEHLLQEIARYGVTHIVLLAGRFGEQIADLYDGRRLFGAHIEVLVEREPLGTAGALRFAEERLASEFLLLNGDSWIDADLVHFALQWRTAKAVQPTLAAQMLLQSVPDVGRYGSVMVDNGRVTAFREKARDLAGCSGHINAGVYLLSKEVIGLIPGGVASSLEADILPLLISSRQVVAVAAPENTYFIDIGVPESLARAQEALQRARTRAAVFFDRDGTLNRDFGYTHRVEDLAWMQDAREAIAFANAAGFLVFVVTNQAGVARGLYDERAIAAFHGAMQEQLFDFGAHIDAIEWCPHHIDGVVEAYRKQCGCRKPLPGMINNLLGAWPVDRTRSLFIGDAETDMQAAGAAGIRAFRYEGGSLLNLLQKAISTFEEGHVD